MDYNARSNAMPRRQKITGEGFAVIERIKELRRARGLTQRALAARSGLSDSAIAHIELGWNLLTLAAVEKLAAGLGVSIRELLAETGAPVVLADDPFCMEIAALLPKLTPTHRADILRVLRDL